MKSWSADRDKWGPMTLLRLGRTVFHQLGEDLENSLRESLKDLANETTSTRFFQNFDPNFTVDLAPQEIFQCLHWSLLLSPVTQLNDTIFLDLI